MKSPSYRVEGIQKYYLGSLLYGETETETLTHKFVVCYVHLGDNGGPGVGVTRVMDWYSTREWGISGQQTDRWRCHVQCGHLKE